MTESENNAAGSRAEDKAETEFWRLMKFVVPTLLSIAVVFYVYMLTYLTGLFAKMQAEIEQLRKDVDRLREDDLGGKSDKQSDNIEPLEAAIIAILR